MTHALHVWAEEARVATIEHEGRNDHWSLSYANPWVANAQAYPLLESNDVSSLNSTDHSAKLLKFRIMGGKMHNPLSIVATNPERLYRECTLGIPPKA